MSMAAAHGLDPRSLDEEHAARAWARYCAGQDIETANERAMADIVARLPAREAA